MSENKYESGDIDEDLKNIDERMIKMLFCSFASAQKGIAFDDFDLDENIKKCINIMNIQTKNMSKAFIYLMDGNFKQTISCLDKILELNPLNKTAFAWRKYAMMPEFKYTKFKSDKIEGKNAYEWYLDGKKKYDKIYDADSCVKTIKCLDKLIDLYPDFDKVWYLKGLVLNKLDQYEKSSEIYDLKSSDSKKDIINVLENQARLKEAIDCFNKALQLKQSSELFSDKGMIHYKMSEWNEAIECYDKAIQLDLDSEKKYHLWYKKGNALRKIGQNNEAIKCYDISLEFDPFAGPIKYYKKSVDTESDSKEIEGRTPEVWFNEAVEIYYKSLGLNPFTTQHGPSISDAIFCLDKLIKINPNIENVWYNKGFILDGNESIKCYEKSLKINPEFMLAWYKKGETLAKLEHFKKAIKCYDKVILLKPEYKFAWYKKADALKELGKYQEADTCLEKWLELNSDYLGWYKRGQILFKFEQFENAIDCFNKSLELNPYFIDSFESKIIAMKYNITETDALILNIVNRMGNI